MSDFDLNDDSLTSYTYKMVQQVQEEADRFIFQTIQPFCEKVMETTIEKKELEQALLKTKAKKLAVIGGRDCCPVCMSPMDTSSYYGRRECNRVRVWRFWICPIIILSR